VAAFDPAAARAAVDAARRDLGHLQAFELRHIGELETRVVHEEDWAEAWKQHFPVLRIGRRVVIRPTWREHEATDDQVVISLDPGMAFGTGLHPTTRLCLAGVEDLATRGLIDGATILDVGCGSGILSIAAVLMGGRSALGIDTDPLAVETTLKNAALNGIANQITARTGSLRLADAAKFDIILANLIASVLIDLADELAGTLEPGGHLLASGIFQDREWAVRDAFESAGMRVVGVTRETEWLAMEAELAR